MENYTAASTGSKMGSSSVTNYNNHFVGWVREQNKGEGGGRGGTRDVEKVKEAVGTDTRAHMPAGFKPFRCGSQRIYRLVNVP